LVVGKVNPPALVLSAHVYNMMCKKASFPIRKDDKTAI
jgi:hypothetical protein